MEVDHKVFDIIDSVYRAAIEPELWTESLAGLCRAIDVKTGALWLSTDRAGPSEYAYNKDPEAVRTFLDHFIGVLPHAFWSPPPGRIYETEAIIGSRSWQGEEFYNDWSRPFGLERDLNVLIADNGTSQARLTLFRERNGRTFTPEDTRLLDVVAPHCRRAFAVHRCFEALRAERDTLAAAVESFRLGLVFLDRDGRVIAANGAARDITARADGLSVARGRLRGADARRSRALDALIRAAVTTGSGAHSRVGGGLLLDRPSLGRPYQIMVSPMRSHVLGNLGVPGCAAMVVIADPERSAESAVGHFARQFRLSGRETQVVEALLTGAAQPAIAETLGVSVETVRTLVKRIYIKTDCRRRSDLIRLLLSGPAALTGAHEAGQDALRPPTG